MVDFLHGVETTEILAGPRPIQQVKSAVIGIVGTAPIHHVAAGVRPELHKAGLILSDRNNAVWGPDLAGYSIPSALKAIQDKGAGTVFAINVFDPATHKTSVAATVRNIVDKKVQLPDGDLISLTVTTAADGACALGTDYTVDLVKGLITIVPTGNLNAAATCKVAHLKGNPGAVDAEDIIGGVNATTNAREGMQAFLDCSARFGFGPKILIAPGYSDDATVRAALNVLAQEMKLRGVVLVDLPLGTTVEEALESRGLTGAVDARAADERIFYCFPYTRVSATKLEPLSQHLAGVIAKTDAERGYWHSPSNKQLDGIIGMEIPLTAAVNDPESEVNALNAAGIVTIFSGNGVGLRAWGNRSSAFPGSSDITTFMSVRRTIDVVDESVELASLRYLDGPVTSVLITAVLADVNAFLRTLVSRGALMPGSRLEYFADDNAPADLAQGKVVFTKTMCPPPPAERITYKSVIDVNLLKLG